MAKISNGHYQAHASVRYTKLHRGMRLTMYYENSVNYGITAGTCVILLPSPLTLLNHGSQVSSRTDFPAASVAQEAE